MAAQFTPLKGKVLLPCPTFLCLPAGCLGTGDLGVLRAWTLLSPAAAPPNPSLCLERRCMFPHHPQRQSILKMRYHHLVGTGKGECLPTCC